MRHTTPFILTLLWASTVCGDWTQFRGTHQNSLAAESTLPLSWSPGANIAWQVDLPGRGVSSPIVADNRVIVTCSSELRQDRLHVLCFDTKSGRRLWHRQLWANGRTMTHPVSANAAPTPASDGRNVYAFYSSNDLVCYDLDGNLRWYRGLAYDYPKAGNDIGMSSSPVVAANTVVVQVENQGDSFVAGIDTESGENRWRIDRRRAPNWSSPAVMRSANGQDLVLLKSSEGLTARDIVSGEEVWSYATNADGISSVLTMGSTVFLPSDGLTALDVSNQREPKLKWSSSRVRADSACPIAFAGQLFALGGNILTCAAADTGEVKWKLRLEGDFWATPVLAGGHLYCINSAGVTYIVKIGADGTIVGTPELGEPIFGSPAVADNGLFVRSDKHLWKIAAP